MSGIDARNKMVAHARPAARRRLDSAVRRLLACQTADGAWRDFPTMSTMGPSDGWVTAYTAVSLAHAGAVTDVGGMGRALERAADLLAGRWGRRDDRWGWGYNHRSPNDCDSTAWAIMALRACGRPIPATADDLLRPYGGRPGWFRTYPATDRPSTWRLEHPDVSAVANLALADPVQAATFLDDLIRQVLTLRRTPCFWWLDTVYTAHAAGLLAAAVPGLDPWRPRLAEALSTQMTFTTPFNAALSGIAAWCLGLDDAVEAACAMLLSSGNPQGAWFGSAQLRLPIDAMTALWMDHHLTLGPSFPDADGIFTTATCVRFLSLLLGGPAGMGLASPAT